MFSTCWLEAAPAFECEPRGAQHRLLIVMHHQRQALHQGV